MPERPFDVVIYGATGFVGRHVVNYFACSRSAANLRWALGGRDRSKLESIRAVSGPGAEQAGVVVADSRDAAAVDALTAQARILLNTAGPFALYGGPVVEACVRHRTHYVDITGETPWVRRLIEKHHETAAKEGTRIIPCCGFDSVPSDLGTYLVVRYIREQLNSDCTKVSAYFQMYGGFNGGTIASALHGYETGELASQTNPYYLNPKSSFTEADERAAQDVRHSRYDPDIEAWVGPFFMAPINTRVVRRSAALLEERGEPYGQDFSYQEYLKYDPPFGVLKARLTSGGMAAFETALDRSWTRSLLKRLLPKPGEGPSEGTIKTGWFRCELIGLAADGRRVRGFIAHSGDPSNSATAEFVAEAALTLAFDSDSLPGGPSFGGVLTPASALGEPFSSRIRAAGTRLEIEA